MLDFLPPKESALVRLIAWLISPAVLRRAFGVHALDIDAASVERVRGTTGCPTVIAPNHPLAADPALVYLLSRRAQRRFRFMAARETFGRRGLARVRGSLMQGLGVYSVIRGAADRRAIRTTTETLTNGRRAVALFPEGVITNQNGAILPFERGVAQACFWALDALRRAGDRRPLYILPTAVRYRYLDPMWTSIDAALTRLERKLTIKGSPPSTPGTQEARYARLRRVGATIVSTVEREYGIDTDPRRDDAAQDLNVRIGKLRQLILGTMERELGLVASESDQLSLRIASIRNAVDGELLRDDAAPQQFALHLRSRRLAQLHQFYAEIQRMRNFISIYDGYVAEDPTAERFLETIRRFEKEVFGRARLRGRKSATVRCGQPLDLSDSHVRYRAAASRAERHAVTEEVTRTLEDRVRALLDAT